jgi:hypothetical protein
LYSGNVLPAARGSASVERARLLNVESPSMAIKIKPSRKGLLHKKLGVPQGESIPAGKLQAALNSASAATRKEAQFAKNAKTFKH